jgi:alpha-1,6-mannosyltransferase
MRLTNRLKISLGLLLLLGFASFVLYRVGVRAEGVRDIQWFIKVALVQSVLYLAAVCIILRTQPSRTTLLVTLGFAVLFRLSIVFSPPYLSDDIYRYIWDGRVQAAGINPYRYVPSAPELAHLRDDKIYPKINRRDYAPTIYPPLAEGLFFVTTRVSESVVWMKLVMIGFEGVAIWAMVQLLASFGMSRQRVLIYAWHPLVVWELAGSGHVDAIVIAFILLAFLAWRRNANVGTGLALAGATLIKVFPLVLLPAVLRRQRWVVPLVFVVTIMVAYVPYLNVGPGAVFGFLPGYAREQGLVTGQQFYLLNLARKLFGPELPSMVYVIATVLIMGAIACWAMLRNRRREDNLVAGLVLATATTVLFAPHYSWYFAWLAPFLCFTPSVAVFYLTIASFVLYGTWLGDSPEQMFFMNSIIYLPFVVLATIELLWRRFGVSGFAGGTGLIRRAQKKPRAATEGRPYSTFGKIF